MAGVDSLPVREKIAFRRKSIRVMGDLVNLSLLMVRAEDYQRARDNFFASGRRIWFMFGGTVKRLDADLGNKIEAKFNSINTMLDQQAPTKNALVSDLTELDRLMQIAVKTSDEGI
ncbi:hypothetical protein GS597_06680 [Synechococcales cyanobacterium C]|uniref:Uncharacterized protein n=1 Tax=Petrachloros mirabilis ULC683 TaxID=2781853 RepID=A0A8K1ZY20_9CYAN|nr:hypothetical protein [Petrachloros mirabilis]NCJ06208.1 hypothetical protein [Petrachloros mirabilis ULC683]